MQDLILEKVPAEGEVLELGDLPEDGRPVADGARADAPDLPVLQRDGLPSRLVVRNCGRAEEAERYEVLEVLELELPRWEVLIVGHDVVIVSFI